MATLEVTIAATLLFVHGTGVRKSGFDRSLDAIQAGCDRVGIDQISVRGVSWGEQLGTRSDLVDETLPVVATRAFGVQMPGDEEAARWEVLLTDPLFELRVVAGSASDATTLISVGQQLPEQELVAKVASAADVALPEVDAGGVSPEELQEAVRLVAESDELDGAARAAVQEPSATSEFAAAAARAVVAVILASHESDPPGESPVIAYNAELRDALVQALTKQIAPDTTRGAGEWLGRQVGGFIARRATSAFENRRGKVSVGSLPFLGDILYYQKRGEAIRDFVAQAIDNAPRPVVAVGHSLGGIILVDLLTRKAPPAVERLVTVGSQSPLFYAIDALDRIRREQQGPQPPPFTPWLNIYDRADFLAFVAARVFPNVQGIRDEEISSRVPFPSSHSAYFHQPRTFELIRDFVAA